jgi:S-adenosylmethionine synthetase
MSIEAPAGKNPLDHTGKIYGVVTHRLAQQAYEITGQETEAHIFTTKEAPLTDPDEVVLRLADGSAYEVALQQLMQDSIAGVGDITREFIETGATLW